MYSQMISVTAADSSWSLPFAGTEPWSILCYDGWEPSSDESHGRYTLLDPCTNQAAPWPLPVRCSSRSSCPAKTLLMSGPVPCHPVIHVER